MIMTYPIGSTSKNMNQLSYESPIQNFSLPSALLKVNSQQAFAESIFDDMDQLYAKSSSLFLKPVTVEKYPIFIEDKINKKLSFLGKEGFSECACSALSRKKHPKLRAEFEDRVADKILELTAKFEDPTIVSVCSGGLQLDYNLLKKYPKGTRFYLILIDKIYGDSTSEILQLMEKFKEELKKLHENNIRVKFCKNFFHYRLMTLENSRAKADFAYSCDYAEAPVNDLDFVMLKQGAEAYYLTQTYLEGHRAKVIKVTNKHLGFGGKMYHVALKSQRFVDEEICRISFVFKRGRKKIEQSDVNFSERCLQELYRIYEKPSILKMEKAYFRTIFSVLDGYLDSSF